MSAREMPYLALLQSNGMRVLFAAISGRKQR